jgi:hypothetical protein
LTLLDLDELLLPYLAEHPPVDILVAGFVGFKPRSRGSSLPGPREAADLAAALGPGFTIGEDVHAGLTQVAILDFAQLKNYAEGTK